MAESKIGGSSLSCPLIVLPETRGVWDLQRSPPLMNQGLLIEFFDFLIAEVFFHEIYRAAKI